MQFNDVHIFISSFKLFYPPQKSCNSCHSIFFISVKIFLFLQFLFSLVINSVKVTLTKNATKNQLQKYYFKLVFVRLKSKGQHINTVTIYLRTPLVGVVFKHIDQIQETLLPKLIWRHICSAMDSFVSQGIFRIVNVSQQKPL